MSLSIVSLDLDSTQGEEPVIMYIVEVHDNGIDIQHSANATIYIQIERVNEYAPVITTPDKSLTITENTAVGTVLFKMSATDLDSGEDGRVTYDITSADPNNFFAINANGNLTVQNNIDREAHTGFTLTLTASDSAPLEKRKQSSINVIVAVSDENDNAPAFAEGSYSFIVFENAKFDSQVGVVKATDPDYGVNGQVEYSILSSTNNGSSLFRISKSGGVIFTTNSNLDLDFLELVSKQIRLTVLASDKGTPHTLNNTVDVTLTISAVNEYTPVLKHSNEIIIQLSSNTVGSSVIDINATDQDYGLDGKLVFTFSSGNEDGDFAVDNRTGTNVQSNANTHLQ